MKRDGWIQLGAGGVLLLLFAASTALSVQIAASAGRNRLVYADTAEAGDPPEVALGIAMGAFRGVFVNFLWIRANDLKEDGKYYEAVDLAKTITKLQPRFPHVWVFHAWNLAYNISVATQTPHERWQWVQAGIRLLRDEGIPSNPGDLLIHRELAWIHLHKIQGYMDDANRYYKREFAREWTIALGPPPGRSREGRSTREAIADHVQRLRRIADAKDTLDEVVASGPQAAELVRRLRTQARLDPANFRPDESAKSGALAILEAFEYGRSLNRISENLGVTLGHAHAHPEAMTLLHDPTLVEGWDVLIPFLRKRVLTDRYRMEPERMIRFTEKYGPLDWRHPAAHAVYWSARGVEETLLRINEQNRKDFDIVNTDRVTIQAVQELYRSGYVIYDILNPELFLQLHNAEYIEIYASILDELRGRSEFDVSTRVYTIYSAGYENFLRDAIRFLYRRGDAESAAKYYEQLREFRYLNDNDPAKLIKLSAPLNEFVVNEVVDDDRFSSPEVARSEVMGALQAAYFTGLLASNDKVFRSNIEYARTFHTLYTEKQVFSVAVNQGDQARLEAMDRDFNVFAGRILAASILASGLPEGPLMYARAPDWLKLRAYPFLVNSPLKAQLDAAEKGGAEMGFSAWFRTPPGYTPDTAQPQQPPREAPRMQIR